MGISDLGVDVSGLLSQVINIVSPTTSEAPVGSKPSATRDMLNMPTATENQLRDALRSMYGRTTNTVNTPPKSSPPISEVPASTGYQNPIKGKYYCTGVFGHGDARHKGVHNGADLRAPGGTPVYPITEGTVTHVGGGGKGGISVTIQHADKITSRYAHLGTVSVHPGDSVNKNTVIATVGDSGNAAGTAPHIHFEIKENGTFVNPNKYIYVPPYSDLQPEEKGNLWLSDEAKNTARSFDVNKHLANTRVALTNMIDKLEKIANVYYSFTIDGAYDDTLKSAEQLALSNMYIGAIANNSIVIDWKDKPDHPSGIWLILDNANHGLL